MKLCVPRLPETTCAVKDFIESAVRNEQRGQGLLQASMWPHQSHKEDGALDLRHPETSHSSYNPKWFQDKQLTILRNVQFTVG